MVDLLSLVWDDGAIRLNISLWLWGSAVAIALVALGWRWWAGAWAFREFEIDQAEFGVGSSKFRFRPNLTDRQVAYAIWVELSTRKIGLRIDFEHDVVAEIYDSWHHFFTVTRELIKSVPASQVRRDGTQAIINLSIEVLNEGLRPHLTRWQARFRRWYERKLKHYDNAPGDSTVIDPQLIQAEFPQFAELKSDMERVNQSLMRYREKMRELIMAE